MFSRLLANLKSASPRQGVPGLLAIVLLNMAVLPCAMAFQGDEDCPHCPPPVKHENGHEMDAHHGHNQAKAEPGCATVQADCCEEITASVDARGSKLEWKPASDGVFVIAPLPDNNTIRPLALWHGPSGPPRTVGSSPPLHVLFCVYLK